jgi:hypothetical protein
MMIKLSVSKVPKHAHVLVKLPNTDRFEDIGDLPIVDGIIYLPVPFVFLSYAREDSEKVQQINSELRDKGILTWFDKQDLLPGDNWQTKIEEAIETSDYILIFLSPKSINKRGTFQREMKYALDQLLVRPNSESYIIPVLLEECVPPREFKDIQWACGWEEDWLEGTIAALRQ